MKIALAVTGASGSIYAHLLMEKLETLNSQIERLDLVFSSNADTVWQEEIPHIPFHFPAWTIWERNNYYAPFASGSAQYDALIICPCSMGTLSRIAQGSSDSLITRAADVMLKERKKLICVIRETPYNLIHINNMKKVMEAGGIILPASPSFYHQPETLEEAVMSVVERIIQQLGLQQNSFKWGE